MADQKRKPTQKEVDTRYAKGMKTADIAAEFGISGYAVHKADAKYPRHPLTTKHRAAIKAAMNGGQKETAKKNTRAKKATARTAK